MPNAKGETPRWAVGRKASRHGSKQVEVDRGQRWGIPHRPAVLNAAHSTIALHPSLPCVRVGPEWSGGAWATNICLCIPPTRTTAGGLPNTARDRHVRAVYLYNAFPDGQRSLSLVRLHVPPVAARITFPPDDTEPGLAPSRPLLSSLLATLPHQTTPSGRRDGSAMAAALRSLSERPESRHYHSGHHRHRPRNPEGTSWFIRHVSPLLWSALVLPVFDARATHARPTHSLPNPHTPAFL